MFSHFPLVARRASTAISGSSSFSSFFVTPVSRHFASLSESPATLPSAAAKGKPVDPYPLPLSHPVSQEPLESSIADETGFTLKPLDRSYEDLETTRKRLVYQARKRGMLEGDLLLATFAREKLHTMTKEEVQEFDKLLDEPDWDIYYWCTDKKPAPERWANSQLLEQLRIHTRNEGRVVRKMPALDEEPTGLGSKQ